MRIVSLLPSATEMVCALGLDDQLVGVTHECDYPASARTKPAVVRNALPVETMSQGEIDAAVAERLREGLSLYLLDHDLIERLSPDLIITQSLCDVCAPSQNELAGLLGSLNKKPEILWMTPRTLGEISGNILDLGKATGRVAAAERLVQESRDRLDSVSAIARTVKRRPRVFCMEWLDPVYCSGHWVPEMVRLAGGVDALGREGSDSVRMEWQRLVDWQPEILIFMPCGYDLEKALEQSAGLSALPGYADLPAVRNNRIYAVDASAYFARPGPRTIDGVELMAHLIHPELFDWQGPREAYGRIAAPTAATDPTRQRLVKSASAS